MFKLFKSLGVAVLMVLLIAGVGSATLSSTELEALANGGLDFTFMQPDTSVLPGQTAQEWATLHVELAVSGDYYLSGFNTLMYTLSNDGTYGATIHSLWMPSDDTGLPATFGHIAGGVDYIDAYTSGDILFFNWIKYDDMTFGLKAGESSSFWIRDDAKVDEGEAMLFNGGGASSADTAALLVGFGGGTGQDVPEPATLLLLGGGFLGVGALRYARRRRVN